VRIPKPLQRHKTAESDTLPIVIRMKVQRRILSETALLVIYLLLFAWNILNKRFV
jgi:hypothetical protein